MISIVTIAASLCGIILVLILVMMAFLRNYTNRCPSSDTLVDPTSNDLKNFDTKVILITGANAGIGLATTKTLVKTQATIIMGCRNTKEASQIATNLSKETKNDKIIVEKLDLAKLSDIKKFCENIRTKHKISKIDTIICNAGISPQHKNMVTKDGFEIATGVNHLGHMYLVLELRDLLFKNSNKNNPSRLIVTSGDIYQTLGWSWKNKLPSINNDDNWDSIWNIKNKNVYSKQDAYSISKLCNIWFTKEFSRKYCNDNKCIAVSLHPGVGLTDLGLHRSDNGKKEPMKWILKPLMGLFKLMADTKDQLAYTQCWCTITNPKNLKTGKHYRGNKIAKVHSITESREHSQKMWDLSIELIESALGEQINK